MKRDRVGLAEISDWTNLASAFARASLGKRGRPDVEAYRGRLDHELQRLREGLLSGDYRVGRMKCFMIRDPKPRIIHAPRFEERVLHHAIIAKIGPRIDRALVDDVYACRVGKGGLAAIKRVQAHARRAAWYAQIDIRQYFPSIDHRTLMGQLTRLFSDRDLLDLIEKLIASHETTPGKGLPIGSLLSQTFANLYLGRADRVVTEHAASRGYVRYMDDLVWWGDSRLAVREVFSAVTPVLERDLGLEIKAPIKIARSRDGVAYCGYRAFPDRILLSRRRKRRYLSALSKAEADYRSGELDASGLQRFTDAAIAITAGADAIAWRRASLARAALSSEPVEA